MGQRRTRTEAPKPFTLEQLEQTALFYVGRYATTRKRLGDYLRRKIRERGWAGNDDAPIDAIVERIAASGYVDDQQFAAMKVRSLARRGYGTARARQALFAAGIAAEDGEKALEESAESERDAALAYAKRRKLGPFSSTELDTDQQRKAIAAMCRAGHSFQIARALVTGSVDFLQDES